MNQAIEVIFMIGIDLMFFVGLVLVMLPLGLWRQAAFAVMKRNFVGYFSNPTGYVFLCLFVLLTSFAAFWPHEFFTTNLANFDQLNRFLPYIMLVFIPAITMSIWADERRQGTDELLLTLPAKDIDIVIGKYFAAVLVFTVSLLFSQVSNYAVLVSMTGGQLDSLLLFSTYVGYWFMGLAMLSLGMVASFLTNNLTVGFVFGAAFNAPLAFFSNADVILSETTWIQRLFEWSLLFRFEPFGRGLISAASVCYFVGLAVLGVYLSLILIGRRHWLGGRDGTSMLSHYLLRGVFLFVTLVAIVLVVQYSPLNRLRADISDNKVSTLSPATIAIIQRLVGQSADEQGRPPDPIKVEAFISNNIPGEYVRTRYDLVNLLRELDVLGGHRIQVMVHQGIEPFSKEAILAEQRYGIRPQTVVSKSRGAWRNEVVVLGVAVSSGLQRVVIPFVPSGTAVEYEIVRSINTVSESRKPVLGIVQSDALLMGGRFPVMNPQTQQPQMIQVPPPLIVGELQKQYQIEAVDAELPIALWIEGDDATPQRRRFDALLVVQPSKLTPVELTHVIAAIQQGQPTAIFEDVLPSPENFSIGEQPFMLGTYFPKVLPRKSTTGADIQLLLDALELRIERFQLNNQWIPNLVWKLRSDNPYPRDPSLDEPEIVIVSERDASGVRISRDHPATTGINELCFQYATPIQQRPGATLSFQELVRTGSAGTIRLIDWMRARTEDERENARGQATGQYVLAAAVRGDLAGDSAPPSMAEAQRADRRKTNVIFVTDVDLLTDQFVELRNEPIRDGIEYRFQNVAFVLNVIDSLAGIDDYLALRSRRLNHVTLQMVEQKIEDAMGAVISATQEYEREALQAREQVMVTAQAEVRPLEEEIRRLDERRNQGEPIDVQAYNSKRLLLQQTMSEQGQRLQRRFEELEAERQEKLRAIHLEAELAIQAAQRQFKLAAVIIPPIPPLLVGLVVFTRRRLREREGISKARRLK